MAQDGEKTVNPRAHWPEALQREFEQNEFNGCVGSVLVSETDKVRVWHLYLPPGYRCNFHRHVNDYFWSAHNAGKARGYYHDGRIVDVEHYKGETKISISAKASSSPIASKTSVTPTCYSPRWNSWAARTSRCRCRTQSG